MTGNGLRYRMCGSCEGEGRETTGYWTTETKTHRKSRKCPCCKGQPMRRCADTREFRVDSSWIARVIENWAGKAEFVLALERHPKISPSQVIRLRQNLGGNFLSAPKRRAFQEIVNGLMKDLAYLGDYARITGTPAAKSVVRMAVRVDRLRQKPDPAGGRSP